jgi:ribosome-binding protein aMBF1 (putative translation factor)
LLSPSWSKGRLVVLIVRGLIVRFARIVSSMNYENSKNIQTNFGRAVRRIRTIRGISQEQLAHASGLDRSYIGGVERGERNPSLTAIEKIAFGLNVSLSELFAECANANRKSRRSAELR